MGKAGFSLKIALFIVQAASISLFPKTSLAQDDTWSVSAANWMQYWYFKYGDGQFIEARRDSLDNRFIVDFDLGDFYTGAWLNIRQFNFPSESSEGFAQRYFGWRDENLSVRLGNFYQVFDRGLTLNAFLDDAIYFDNNLDGVRISGNYDRFEFNALSARGLNRITRQREYAIRGARGAIRPLNPVKLGFSYVRFKQNSSDFFRTLNSNLTSVNSGVSYGPIDLYAEYAKKVGRTDSLLPQANLNGDGTYLSGSISFEKASVYSEYKNYINLLYPANGTSFNNPPPASHQGRSLMSLDGIPGERGYQLGFLISPSFDLNLDLSFSESYSRGIPDSQSLYIAEKFAGLRWSAISDFVLNYNWDKIDYTKKDEIENYFDGYYYISDRHIISLTTYTKRFINNLYSPGGGTSQSYHEDYMTLGYGMGNLLVFNVGGSKSNQKQSLDPEKMAFVELTLRFGSHELIVFNGGERGGLICSSGICQIRPTFQGTRVILFSRF